MANLQHIAPENSPNDLFFVRAVGSNSSGFCVTAAGQRNAGESRTQQSLSANSSAAKLQRACALALNNQALIDDDASSMENTLRARLPSLLKSLQSEVGILWIRTSNGQLRWVASQGIDAEDMHEQSVFARDLLWNAEETLDIGCCQIFNACDEGVFATLPYGPEHASPGSARETHGTGHDVERDATIRSLVCEHAQLLMPVELPGINALFCAFVPANPRLPCGVRIFELDNAIDAVLADGLAPQTISLSQGW
ncbi:MAG: hypothetical protein AAGG44_06085 [Planctomycetota bacterium]